jgi:FtsP/CotA-like multicopper oxidase with cupredoxin domain
MNLSKNFPDSDKAKPEKDISINSVPIRYLGNGKYDQPAIIKMEPNQQQFWRVANTAADTYFDLQVQYDGVAVPLELVAMDGVPISVDGLPLNYTKFVNHILLPPAGRAEFIIKAPGVNVKNAAFLTLNYDTGTDGDNDPTRTIARIDTQAQTTAKVSNATVEFPELGVNLNQISGDRFSELSQNTPTQQRTLYFSETDPNVTPSEFYITVLGNKPKVYDPDVIDITVREGTTEDWIIENRSQEAHAFHIHQIHFLVLESPDASEIGMMRDTISVPSWNGDSKTPYPSVKLRMDFRGAQKDTSIAGTFVYHCHILEHEDGGMMGTIQIQPL